MKKELTKAEEQIMHAIWAVKKGFAKDILEQLSDPKPAYNTVLTVVRVLVQKGFVKFNTYGKSNEYFATITKDEYSNQKLDSIKRNYFNNSSRELLSFFVKENKMDIDELDELLKSLKTKEDE